jgi:catechol 2,3-dioxygenase-like lactoylglutathione lyase family enzyme
MTLKFDHIVIAVHDLDATIRDYGALGFNVLRGGDHPGRTTHNALVVFEDGSYFELIAWKAPAPEERWWQWLQRHGEGIVDFALLPPDTGEVVRAAARRGLVLDGPIDGGRVRPDGERLRWQVARPPSPDLPFLCGDLTPRGLRVPEGAARVHPNGARGVASLTIAVRDLAATLARYRALLGPAVPGQASCIGGAQTLPGTPTRLALITLGDSTLQLVSPKWTPTTAEPVDDPISVRLALRGEGPFAVVLHATGTGASVPLDLARSHGAAIELENQVPVPLALA